MEGRSCNRNQGIIARLYVKARTHLISRSRNRGVSKEDAEDQIQDLFVSMLEGKIAWSSDDEVALRQLASIQKNDAIDHFRTALRRGRLSEGQSMRSSEVGSPPCTAVQVDQMLDRLPAEQEEAVVSNIVWGKTASEIGEATGTSPNTVSSRIRAALRAMACMALLLPLAVKTARDVLSTIRRLLGRPRARLLVVLGVSGLMLLAPRTVQLPSIEEAAVEMKTDPFARMGSLKHLELHPPEPPKPEEARVPPKDSRALPDDGAQRKNRLRSSSAPRTKTAEKIPGEGELIARAMECLHSAPELAEAALHEHKRVYPNGHLATERDILLSQLASKAGNQRDRE